jgi:cytochrome c biogenesis protein CcmG/thiol:disulfide interchange protein DsbE
MLGAGLLIGVGLGVLLFFGFGPGASWVSNWLEARYGGETPPQGPSVGYHASDFELNTLAGEPVHLAELRGRPVVINFWATWCGPCREEMPLLEAAYTRYGDGLAVLGVNYDEPQEMVQEFVDEMALSFPILLDPRARVQKLYRVRAFPTTYFLDEEGVIRFHHIGVLNEKQLAAYLEQLGVGE